MNLVLNKGFVFLGVYASVAISLGCMVPESAWGGGFGKNLRIESETGQVQLEIRGETLVRVLREVERRAGVRFFVTERLAEDLVTVQLTGRAWREVIEQLLRDYSVVASWDPGVQRVWVVGRQDSDAKSGADPSDSPGVEPSVLLEPDESLLDEAWLQKLRPVDGGHSQPPPPAIQGDPLALYFWESFGVEFPRRPLNE